MARPKKVPAKKAPPPPPAPLVVITSTAFDRDLVLVNKRGWDLGRLETVIETLRERRQLARKHRDHALKGEWRGHRDCHEADDW